MAGKDPLSEIAGLTKAVEQLGVTAERTMGILGGSAIGQGKANILSGALGMVGGIVSGGFGMMPDVAGTVARAGGYYNSSRMMGGINRQRLSQATFSGLAGGLSSVGVDAMVAQNLSNMGVNFSTNANSQYMRVVRGAGNATKYLNMETDKAATAIAGMNTGGMSATLMRNFGISTSDPRTGQAFSQAQIFQQLAQRMTAGRGKASVSEVRESLYRGALGASIAASGMTQDQQAMFSQYMIERAKGNNMDLSDPKAMEKIRSSMAAAGNDNPFNAAYQINSSTTGAQSKAETQYLAGLQTAANHLDKLNQISGDLAATFGSLNSYASAMAGSQVGKGAMGVAGSLVGGASSIASSLLTMRAVNKLSGGAGAAAGEAGAAGKLSLGSRLGKGVGPALLASAAGNVAGSVASSMGASAQWSNALSQAGNFAGIGAMVGSMFAPGVGTAVGAGIGGLLGGVAGYFTGGTKSTIGLGSGSGSGTLKLMSPTKGSITAHFGERGPMWGSEGHHGIDYGVPEGTPVVAAADGTVSYNDSGALGNVIRVTHSGGFATQYAHLSRKVAPAGTDVKQGQIIAYSGATGTQQNGAHLHFELWQGGGRINPAPYLGIGFSSSALQAATWGITADSLFSAGSAPAPSLVSTGVSGVSSGGQASAVKVNTSTATASSSVSAATSSVGGSYARISGRSMGNGYLSNVRGASEGILNVSKDGPVNVHQGEAILPADVAKDYRKDKVFGNKKAGNHVTINLSIAQASESEARKFAKRVKEYLEEDNRIHSMGAA
jgi:murein DD-endopeptidase MepM/ murein hydrolase activator NlpD